KNDERTSHIPIILLTARADVESRLKGLKGGADAYLAKPFNQKELLIRLEKLNELRRQLQARYSTMEKQPAPASPSPEDIFMEKLRKIVEAQLGDEQFGIPELCKAIGMSRSQLHLKIKALTGKPTSHYIRSLRLHRSRELLKEGGLNVTQVAFEVGFRDLSYFSRAFSEEFGHSPSDLIKG
ncbi:MAG: helix-turn-helix domain-containing protein, partial [Phaeodactylibacter sp.]|nr:helix-turn-helix domain-containing protein [Phaeodactylibacter sp.]